MSEELIRKIEEEWDQPQPMQCPDCGNFVMVSPEDLLVPVEDLCECCFRYNEECIREHETMHSDRLFDDDLW